MVTRKVLSLDLVVRIYRPQPFRIGLLICFAVKGGDEVKKKQRCFVKRFVALVAALVISFSLSVSVFAINWPASPSSDDFVSHPNCWYVWNEINLESYHGFELICHPMQEYGATNTQQFPFDSYSTNSSTYRYTNSSGTTVTFMYGVPYIPASPTASWPDLPSFPVGDPSNICGAVRLYPCKWRDYLASVSDVFNDRSVYGYLTSWPSDSSSIISDYYDHEVFAENPVYIPSNIFFFGSKTDSSTNHTSYVISNGDNDFWASPYNANYLKLSKSHLSTLGMRSFPSHFSIPSSDVGFVFCKRPTGDGMHVYNTEFDVSLSFAVVLWVPDSLLPSDVKVGDWISKATVEDLQDELANEFDVDSDTLKNSKDNLNSWNSTSSVDSGVASTSISALNAMFQNLGGFLFIVSLMVFGAVVLRMLIRKAVDG